MDGSTLFEAAASTGRIKSEGYNYERFTNELLLYCHSVSEEAGIHSVTGRMGMLVMSAAAEVLL